MVHIGRMESGGGEYGVSNIRDKFDSIVGEVEECEREKKKKHESDNKG